MSGGRFDWMAEPGCLVLVLAVAYQGAHMVEHGGQVVQHYLLGLPAAASTGLLGHLLDLEIVHLVFNGVLLLWIGHAWRQLRRRPGAPATLTAALAIQTVHMGEHVVRGVQHWAGGVARPAGVVGQVVPAIPLHAVWNLVVLALAAAALVAVERRSRPPLPGVRDTPA